MKHKVAFDRLLPSKEVENPLHNEHHSYDLWVGVICYLAKRTDYYFRVDFILVALVFKIESILPEGYITIEIWIKVGGFTNLEFFFHGLLEIRIGEIKYT